MPFSIFEAMYDTKTDSSAAAAKGTLSYEETLDVIRTGINENHAAELANVIADVKGKDILLALISKYIHRQNIHCRDEPDFERLRERIFDDMAGFGFLTKYLYDDTVEEVNINSWDDIEIVTAEDWRKCGETFLNPQQCVDTIKKMCALGGIVIDGSQPVKDSYIFKGVRISAQLPPCVDEELGGIASIRRQRMASITREQLISWGTATAEELDFLNLWLACGVSVAIAGSTGSGKTTDLSYLLRNVPNDKRIYTIEDSRELELRRKDEEGKIVNRIVHTKTRPHESARSNITSDILLKTSLRFDPDIIVPAEMRGVEAWTVQEAGRTGHTIATTLHANSAESAYARVLTMCQEKGGQLSENLMMGLIIEAFPIMLFKQQLRDKTRKYMSIIEATDYKDGKLVYTVLYKFVIRRQEVTGDGKYLIEGSHRRVNYISDRLALRLLENGAELETIKRYASQSWNPESIYNDIAGGE